MTSFSSNWKPNECEIAFGLNIILWGARWVKVFVFVLDIMPESSEIIFWCCEFEVEWVENEEDSYCWNNGDELDDADLFIFDKF